MNTPVLRNLAAHAVDALQYQGEQYCAHLPFVAVNSEGVVAEGQEDNIEQRVLGEICTDAARLLRQAHCFLFPLDGELFATQASIPLAGRSLQLPYPVIAIEFPLSGGESDKVLLNDSVSGKADAAIILAWRASQTWEPLQRRFVKEHQRELNQDAIVVTQIARMGKYNGRDFWLQPQLYMEVYLAPGGAETHLTPFYSPSQLKYVLENGGKTALQDVFNITHQSVRAVLELLAVLSCANVAVHRTTPGVEHNRRRVKQGKQPFFSYHVLDLFAPEVHEPSDSKVGVGTHASPRLHWRRGHIRRLESRNIWVREALVGQAALGTVQKDYRVNPERS